MSGLLFLTSDDFKIKQGINGPILCTRLSGFSLLLFYGTNCPHCKPIIPMFKKLPQKIHGCQFGLVNINSDKCKQCILLSRQTISPIEWVPYIVIYVNGRPFMSYKGEHTIDGIQSFVMKVAETIRNSSNSFAFSGSNTGSVANSIANSASPDEAQIIDSSQGAKKLKTGKKSGTIPPYTCGIPICGANDDVCYMEFQEAYPQKV